VIVRAPDLGVATLHVATERKSAFELARRRRPDVIPASKDEAVVPMPDDVSLDTSLWRSIRR
jgi:dTDP-4-dehydrorhamnose reductase